MIPVDRNWLGLGGKPHTGRTPPVLCVMNGVQPSPQQMSWIAQCYRQQHDMRLTSVTPYMVQERTLPDGTRVRMVSGYGVDKVMVWTAAAAESGVRSGIGVMVRDVFGQPIYVVLYPQGGFGQSSAVWTEKRVDAIRGAAYPSLPAFNLAWQSSRAKEEYAVTSLEGGSAYRNNVAVARYGGAAVFSVGQALASAHNDIVFDGNGRQYRRLRIRLYNERLTDLNGPSRDLLHVKEVTLNGWTYIDAHPQGGKFLAAREKRYSNLVGITDRLAWFQIDGQGNVTESDTVLDFEFTLHSVDPESTFPEGGPVPEYIKPHHYSHIEGGHVGFDGRAVVHMRETQLLVEHEDPPAVNQFAVFTFVDEATGLPYTRTELVSSVNTEDYSYERRDFFKPGPDTIALTQESNIYAATRSVYATLSAEGITQATTGSDNITSTGERTLREILFAVPKKGLYVTYVRRLRRLRLERTNTSSEIDPYGHDWRRERTDIINFSGEIEYTVEITQSGGVVWSCPVFADTRSIEHRYYRDEGPHIDLPGGVLLIDPPLPMSQRWIKSSTGIASQVFLNNCQDLLTTSDGDTNLFDRPEVIGSADPLTGAAVVQIKLMDASYLLAIDDTGVRNVSQISELIPMGAQADYIVAV